MNQVHPQTEAGVSAPQRSVFNVGTALALAVVISLLAFLLTSSGESPVAAPGESETVSGAADPMTEDDGAAVAMVSEPQAEPSGEVRASDGVADEPVPAMEPGTVPATTIAAASALGGFAEDAALSSRSSIAASGASEITNMGPTEVWFSSNFPLADYTWERIELEGSNQAEVSWLGEFNGMLVAVTSNWTLDGNYSLVTHASSDGVGWETLGSFDLTDSGYVSRIASDGDHLYAFAELWGDVGGNQNVLYTSVDGVTWTKSAFDLESDDNEYVYIQAAAAGPAGLAVAASFESYPGEQPIVLEFDEVQVVIDYMHSTYQVLDAASGDELLAGSLDEVFNWDSSEGQAIWNAETGELIVTVPYEVWEAAYNDYYGSGGMSPLPIPVGSSGDEPSGAITIQYGGYTITIDEMAYFYDVVDSATGEEVVSGSLEFLYQGPPPRFVDPDTGETLLEVSWDEWYQAEELGYRESMPVEGEYSSHTELLSSQDGVTWTSVTVPGQYGASVSSLVPTDTGFVALAITYGDLGEYRSVWTFENGEWTSVESDHVDLWLYQIATTSDGFLGVGDGAGGPALWSSPDGVTWDSEFAVVVQSDGSYASFTDVAADEADNVAALVRREVWSDYEPLVIEKDGYVLTFEDGESLLTVTDSSGGAVLSLTWADFESSAAGEIVTWEDGTTYIDLGNGDIVAIPDEEAWAAMEERWAYQGELGLSVFLRENGSWSEAIVEVDGGLNGAGQVYLSDGKVIIAGTNWDYTGTELYDEGGESSFVIIVGTPRG